MQIEISHQLNATDLQLIKSQRANWFLFSSSSSLKTLGGNNFPTQDMWYGWKKNFFFKPGSKYSLGDFMHNEHIKWGIYPMSFIKRLSPKSTLLKTAVQKTKLDMAKNCQDFNWTEYKTSPHEMFYSYQGKCNIMGVNINTFVVQKLIQNNNERKTISYSNSTTPMTAEQKQMYINFIKQYKL